MRRDRWMLGLGAGATLLLAACGGEPQSASRDSSSAASAPAAAGSVSPDPGNKVIVVDMETDGTGTNKFEPSVFEAKRGDVIRFTLISGVHNANFLADSNPGKSGLPTTGQLLQLPQQTYDVKVTWEPGTYYFQCDPHALLGMTGHVTVKP